MVVFVCRLVGYGRSGLFWGTVDALEKKRHRRLRAFCWPTQSILLVVALWETLPTQRKKLPDWEPLPTESKKSPRPGTLTDPASARSRNAAHKTQPILCVLVCIWDIGFTPQYTIPTELHVDPTLTLCLTRNISQLLILGCNDMVTTD